MSRAVLLLACLLALTCGGCARFSSPAVAEGGPAFDTRLSGHWFLKTGQGRFDVQIRGDDREGHLLAHSDQAGDKDEEARLITAKLGPFDFVSVRSTGSGNEYWSIFRYDFEGDRLIVTPGDDKFWISVVDEKMLEGTVSRGELAVAVTIKATEKQLRDVITGNGAAIFPRDPTSEFVFERGK